MRARTVVLGLFAALVLTGWAGLQVPPASFPAAPEGTATPEVVPLPGGLPAPVERFYRDTYGNWVPVVTTAVVTGRATLRPLPLAPALPARFRFTHEAGRGYRHEIEATWFGRTVLRVDESYLNGVSRQQTPFGSNEGEPKGAQAANLSLWAEAIWFPSLYLTDPRVRWEPLDDETAVLNVPSGPERERLIVRFDPATGRPFLLEAMRYQDVKSPARTLWLTQVLAWGPFGGVTLPRVAALTWLDDGQPWASFTAEDLSYNVNVGETLQP